MTNNLEAREHISIRTHMDCRVIFDLGAARNNPSNQARVVFDVGPPGSVHSLKLACTRSRNSREVQCDHARVIAGVFSSVDVRMTCALNNLQTMGVHLGGTACSRYSRTPKTLVLHLCKVERATCAINRCQSAVVLAAHPRTPISPCLSRAFAFHTSTRKVLPMCSE